MADLQVDTSLITKMIANLKSEYENLEQAVDAMQQGVNELHEVWAGPNHDRLVKEFDALHTSVKSYNHSIDEYISALNQAAMLYEKADDEAGNMIH